MPTLLVSVPLGCRDATAKESLLPIAANALSFAPPQFRMGLVRRDFIPSMEGPVASPWILRHGAMRFLGEFDPDSGEDARGNEVRVRTDRGRELAAVLCPGSPR